ncbi:mandelate racemase/muconate lactonizing enzyme family protein [Parasphingorhabdus sp.]|uniref:mandelate racemase/muconate lactonizing enzyme family protein n=1 Tax=Parasphingorhabdus sp. TaxID=2709688 RepID=UPI002B267331|nr:mandelate racemase/muconate lactonizing enzyme family protein [Parasphingorhabdus sp.]
MKIERTETFILQVPTPEIADSKRALSYLEFVGVRIFADNGVAGTGFFATVGHGAHVVKAALDTLLVEDLIGDDPHEVRAIWQRLYAGRSLWIGRAGAVQLALAAIDIALWDMVAKQAGKPLWQMLGGTLGRPVQIYNTNAGWLNFSTRHLCDEAQRQIDQGYTALKMKVGGPDLDEDIARIRAVRKAIGGDILLMADANQNWTFAQAKDAVERMAEFNLGWIEEPLHPDDLKGHVELRAHCPMPLALGENIYSAHQFDAFIGYDAVDVVQVDVCRVGGITPWLDVAAMADAAGLKICPHAGDIAQIHQHLVRAIPNSWLLEVIPFWEKGPFEDQICLRDGHNIAPTQPGASTDFSAEALECYRIE